MLIERSYFLLVHDVCTLPPDIYGLFIVLWESIIVLGFVLRYF